MCDNKMTGSQKESVLVTGLVALVFIILIAAITFDDLMTKKIDANKPPKVEVQK